MGCENLVQLKHSAHFGTSLQLNKLRHILCSARYFPRSELHSADQLFKSVRRDYQREICSYFRLLYACTLVEVVTMYNVNRYLCLFFLTKYMCSLVPVVILGVHISPQSTGVSLCVQFH